MQEYLTRTHLGEKMDHIGGTLLILLGSVLFFALLWGVRISALLSGGALGAMLLILRERTRRQRLHHREKALRRRIGGEIRLEEWRTLPSLRAHAEAAMLLAKVYPLSPERITSAGAVCINEKNNEKTLVFCAQMHPDEKLCARDIAAYQRVCLQEGAARGIVCGVGGITAAGEEQAQLSPGIMQISYARMVNWAGNMWPATDAQLIALGKRKRRGRMGNSLLGNALKKDRAGKYLLYGMLLCLLYLLLGLRGYLIPGCICLMLMALCRTGRFDIDTSQYL